MNETIISWNAPNWITVFLMVMGGFLIAGAVLKLFARMKTAKET